MFINPQINLFSFHGPYPFLPWLLPCHQLQLAERSAAHNETEFYDLTRHELYVVTGDYITSYLKSIIVNTI